MPKLVSTVPLPRELEGINTVIATVTDEDKWRMRIPGPAMNEVLRLKMNNEHQKLTSVGWSYRKNDRGWIIYSDPQTRRWHTLKDALTILLMPKSTR